ncbi:MAG TPA: hypothetical protein VI854_01580, partial [Acidimicrobiia bacterium]|nr:hypothetical protein [Acidimicrobiia bacterium]
MAPALPVYLECGTKRVFACALDWPGWCRSGRDEEAALEALGAYAGRYRVAAAAAGVEFPAGDSPRFTVVERVAGSATTDFGAPGAVPEADGKRQTAATAERAAGLVAACWAVFDDILAGA